ncbi:dihydroxy-acid dehydratase [Pelosinus sp. sgz500959]|uniref:dihydroxy-acid dehydratase n=1 Tax=Pelosinus sp. sgz500959 TaxID=3242472 RepID=UPI00366CAC34
MEKFSEKALDKLPNYQRAMAKVHLGSCGTSYKELKRPIIAVVNSWNEIVPGHCHLRELAEYVKKGIIAAGGLPLEFNTIAICDGIAHAHEGMKYVLPSRDLIADSVEAVIRGHGIFDGMVMIASCDKIVPGMLMAAARLNIPGIMVTGGPMINKITPGESKKVRQSFLHDEVTEEELFDRVMEYYPTPGICPLLGTANTMCVVAEALGMTLPGSASIPAMSQERKELAERTGKTIIELVEKGVCPKDILVPEAFENAISVILAMGGSLNSVLHIPAIAHECGSSVTFRDFDRISRVTPLIVRIAPSSLEYTMADLYHVGGVLAVMNELQPILHNDLAMVTGETLGERLVGAKNADGKIIRPFAQPFSLESGLAVLEGNLAPEGAVVKTSAVPEELKMYRGLARVFNGQDECMAAMETDDQIQEGDVIVIRYEGPIGGPGMREMHRISEQLAMKFSRIAVVTDGRFSGASAGLSVGYLSPEAAEGGPIALVENGDSISIDIIKRKIHWHVTEEELSTRREKFQFNVGQETDSSFLKLYRSHATSASTGAIRRR